MEVNRIMLSGRLARMTCIHIMLVFCCTLFAEDCILTIRNDGKDFEKAYGGLCDELAGEFKVKDIVVDRNTNVGAVEEAMHHFHPRLVVLMDNSSIGLYRRYLSTLEKDAPVVPSVSLMGVIVKNAISGIRNASGISYEVPIVTSVVSLRAVLGYPVRKVGVVHRTFLNEFLEENREFCRREGIEIVNEELPNRNSNFRKLTSDGLKNLIGKKIDVLWIPNDNALLNPDIIKNVWIPVARKYKIPVIVGVGVLVDPKINFGTFAVLPDHVALGAQAAGIVFDLRENDWEVEGEQVVPPLAVYKILNLKQARKYFKVQDENLSTVDKKLQ